MSMLTLNGVVQNVFRKGESKDKETGEIRPVSDHVQVLSENITQDGEKRLEMVTLKVQAGDAYRKLIGKPVRIPVGAFVPFGSTSILFYALKTEPQPIA